MTLLRALIESTENDLDRERLKQRLARLASGVAVLKVGAVTEGEMRERKDRVDDAVCATKAAVEEGIVPGGGLALLRCCHVVTRSIIDYEENKGDHEDDEVKGMEIILGVLSAPVLRICANAGENGPMILGKLMTGIAQGATDEGFNAATGEFEYMTVQGVIDPAKVVRCALQNAASVAALMLTTEAMVATFAEKKP